MQFGVLYNQILILRFLTREKVKIWTNTNPQLSYGICVPKLLIHNDIELIIPILLADLAKGEPDKSVQR